MRLSHVFQEKHGTNSLGLQDAFLTFMLLANFRVGAMVNLRDYIFQGCPKKTCYKKTNQPILTKRVHMRCGAWDMSSRLLNDLMSSILS
jgi:hypothetical protein